MADESKAEKGFNLNINAQTTPVFFSDHIQMTISENGIVFDVGQRVLNTNQITVVSRFGINREHAKRLLKSLGELLALTEGQVETVKKVKN
jgi:uncharacterized protein YfcZ (UPF0381/DUF406 family)